MLIIFVGPSGAGKTALMEGLCRNYGFNLLENFTTRQLRPGELSRSWISEGEAIRRYEEGEFEFLNSVFGNYYAVTKTAFESAVRSDKGFVFDIYWAHLHKIAHKVQCIVLIRGPVVSTIEQRLVAAGRAERIGYLRDELSGIETLRRNLLDGPLGEKLIDAGDGLRPGLVNEIRACATRHVITG